MSLSSNRENKTLLHRPVLLSNLFSGQSTLVDYRVKSLCYVNDRPHVQIHMFNLEVGAHTAAGAF